MKNYFHSRFFVLVFLSIIIIGGVYFGPTNKAGAICNAPPKTYPYQITTAGGTCYFDCEGDLINCNCNDGYHFDAVAETCVVNVGNASPSVNAGPDFNLNLPTNSVSVTGTASDSDGTITGTNWTKVSGPAGALVSFSPSPTNNLTTTINGL